MCLQVYSSTNYLLLTHVTDWTSPTSSAVTYTSDWVTGGIVPTLTHHRAVLAVQSLRAVCTKDVFTIDYGPPNRIYGYVSSKRSYGKAKELIIFVEEC